MLRDTEGDRPALWPRTNGFVERMNRTLLDECFRVAGRTTWYLEPAEIQRDRDRSWSTTTLQRSHQVYRLGGPHAGAGAPGGTRPRNITSCLSRFGHVLTSTPHVGTEANVNLAVPINPSSVVTSRLS